jgi:hypothetical protein
MIIFTDIGVRDQKSLETTGLVQRYLKWDPGKYPGTHWIGGLVGFRAGLDTEATGTISTGDRTPAIQFVVRHYTDWATPARGCTSREKSFFFIDSAISVSCPSSHFTEFVWIKRSNPNAVTWLCHVNSADNLWHFYSMYVDEHKYISFI